LLDLIFFKKKRRKKKKVPYLLHKLPVHPPARLPYLDALALPQEHLVQQVPVHGRRHHDGREARAVAAPELLKNGRGFIDLTIPQTGKKVRNKTSLKRDFLPLLGAPETKRSGSISRQNQG
jgi:hypothetical protein